MLKSVQKPGGAVVSFEYDALGRRTAKIAGKKVTRYLLKMLIDSITFPEPAVSCVEFISQNPNWA